MLTDTTHSPCAKVNPLPWDAVDWTEGFWKDAFDNNASHTVPHLRKMFESKEISHVLENFRICAGESDGNFGGTDFGDGDFYKWMEAAMYTAVKTGDQELLEGLDSYVDLIGRAQLPDGYLSTKQILDERQSNGVSRMSDINAFEVYNFGHLFTAASLYKRLTGKDSFLQIALKAAAYLENLYEEALRSGAAQTAVCPSHYMGLMELYRSTRDVRWLNLARLSIHLRDTVQDGLDDNQDRIPVKEHEKIIGHAVRANYLYAGIADLCAEIDDPEYRSVLDKMWRNLADQKLYLTGGCGAIYNGASPYGNFFVHQLVHQAYGYEYQLPNITAYNETCASVGSVMWAYRMFQLDPRAEYFDIIERTMLNVNLAAVSLDGCRFFYENMLRRAKKLDFELIWPLTRSEYILSYCCPPNLARAIAESSEYAYCTSADGLWMGLYGASAAKIKLECGAAFTLTQDTAYPYDGMIRLHFSDVENDAPCRLHVRVPHWLESGEIRLGDRKIPLTPAEAGAYLALEDFSYQEDILIHFDMPARYTIGHSLIEETSGQAAVERGPLVYCVETPDCPLDTLDDLMLDLNETFKPVDYEIQGRPMKALEGDCYCMGRSSDYSRDALYQTLHYEGLSRTHIRLIPYFAWDNRDHAGEMRIWLPVAWR